MTWQTAYPARYYAYSNTDATLGGYPTVGWIDVNLYSSKPSWLPGASAMIALTSEEWADRSLNSQIIKDGKIVTYTATTTT